MFIAVAATDVNIALRFILMITYPQCTRGHMPESSYLLRFLRSLRFTYIQYAHLIGLEIIANSYFQVVESEATDMCRGKAESGLRLLCLYPEWSCQRQTVFNLLLGCVSCIFVQPGMGPF